MTAARFSPTQIWIINFITVILVFFLGVWLGGLSDPTETVVEEKIVPVYSGDFNDVQLVMRSSSGTFHYVCDMHFSPEPGDEHTAECEFSDL